MKTEVLEYYLPPERIAQISVQPRDRSRLLVVGAGEVEHKKFFEIVNFLHRGDLLVFNNSKVFRARLSGEILNSKQAELKIERLKTRAEIFLLRPRATGWECLGKPGKKLKVGTQVKFSRTVFDEVAARENDGTFILQFFSSAPAGKKRILTPSAVVKFADRHGEIPVPPYVHSSPAEMKDYQTVYAKRVGSVAAPTAGFHFTKALLKKLKAQGVRTAEVTLHVGIGTFQPIKTETVEAHTMHAEWAEVSAAAAREIARAKKDGRRVIAVGTTSVRTLEAWAQSEAYLNRGASKNGALRPWSADVNLFITPGFKFKVVDALITNFHLPKSTLLLLVAAFLEWRTSNNQSKINGLAELKNLYATAIKNNYRFFSFGDAMFIAPPPAGTEKDF